MKQRDFLNIAIIFLISLILRLYFFGGFSLGDDVEELGLNSHFTEHGITFFNHLTYRFGIWIWNYVLFKFFGVSEVTFFLPNILFSCLIPVLSYLTGRGCKQGYSNSLFIGFFVASSPFEVLLGGLRANDTFLAFFLSLGIYLFFLLRQRPVVQAITLAAVLWFCFYIKLWVVFYFPLVTFFFISQLRRGIYKPSAYFILISAILHFSAGFVWLKYYDTLFPYFKTTSATYPVLPKDILWVWGVYPRMILIGSAEFKTTLFGAVGWLWCVFILIKIINNFIDFKLVSLSGAKELEKTLFWSYVSFFLLLNFLPHNFTLDQYYSVPRIFRYLAPFSFMFSFHVAIVICRINWRSNVFRYSTLVILLFLNIYQSVEATMPTKAYRKKNYEVAEYLRTFSPRTVYMEAWVSSIHKQIYLKNSHYLPGVHNTHKPEDYEKWLKKKEPEIKDGTLLVTGLNGYTHYAGRYVGFRLIRFKEKLGPNWKLLKTFQGLSYMPNYEDIKVWMYSNK